jgi:choline dehydrogenase-like flavoprotein
MTKLLIVGSGASAVHFALSVLKKGYEVTMLDVGFEKPSPVNPQDSFIELKTNLPDPVQYFLGKNFESVIFPDNELEFYGFPPTKNFIFKHPPRFQYRSNGFTPLFSFAQGGLAEAWTAGVYPFNDHELQDFPFGYKDLEPFYAKVAKRIGIMGTKDDLARFFPFHAQIMQPLNLDDHSKHLLTSYDQNKDYINTKFNCYLGRSRVATLSQDMFGRKGCSYCGRCLWGCPSGALYTPSLTMVQCKAFPNFKYIPGLLVNHFKINGNRRITSVIAESILDGTPHEFAADRVVLAAGTLASSKIFLDSIFKLTGEIITLKGLMDNRQVLVPFINLKMIGKPYNPKSYQYHQVCLGLKNKDPKEYVHAQITTLKTAMIHPIIQNLPFDLKTSISIFRNIHAALGVLNINFRESQRQENYLTLTTKHEPYDSRLLIHYTCDVNEQKKLQENIKTIRKVLWKLGCVAPAQMIHVRPMGASVHYTGTLPMSKAKNALTVSADCQSHDFENLFIVDGTTFPFLPAKNLTFTLMANAVRVAENAF